MSLMEITTNIACRVQCDFCPHEMIIEEYSNRTKSNNISYGQPAQMSFEIFKQCLEKLPKSVKISFSGYSEPFLNPDCSKILIYAHELGYDVQVYSTLVGMKLEDIDEFKHIPFGVFQIHLPDASTYAKIAVNDYYLKVLKKILSSNVSNVTAMSMGILHPKIKKILKNNVLPSTMGSRTGNVKKVKIEIEKKLGPLSCGRATGLNWMDNLDANVLLPNGDVAICCNDYGLQNVFGNLIELDYSSLFQTDSFKKIRKKMKSDDSDIICRNCVEAISDDELNKKREFINKILSSKESLDENIVALVIKNYQNLLYRAPDPEGFNFFYSKIFNKEMTVQDMKDHIMQHSEYLSFYEGAKERTEISLIDDL